MHALRVKVIRAWLALVMVLPLLVSCGDPQPYESALVTVVNDTDRTLDATYLGYEFQLFGADDVGEQHDHIGPHSRESFLVYYLDFPEITISGPGYERTYNVFGYQRGKDIVILQGYLVSGGG